MNAQADLRTSKTQIFSILGLFIFRDWSLQRDGWLKGQEDERFVARGSRDHFDGDNEPQAEIEFYHLKENGSPFTLYTAF